jgi:hypothetical protein
MKKLLLLLALPIMLFSCKKEDIKKNGSVLKVEYVADCNIYEIKFDYYDTDGNHKIIYDIDGQIEDLDKSKEFNVFAWNAEPMMDPETGTTDMYPCGGDYKVYLDGQEIYSVNDMTWLVYYN